VDRRTETQSIESEADPDVVVGLLAEANRIPEWAPAFADTVVAEDPRPGERSRTVGHSTCESS
jgi:hypothetical protein